MKLWLDDVRPAPDGWVWVKTVQEAQELLESGLVTHASLDHDLGSDEPTGYDLVKWMAEYAIWPSAAMPEVHSDNPPGRMNMVATINRYCPLARV